MKRTNFKGLEKEAGQAVDTKEVQKREELEKIERQFVALSLDADWMKLLISLLEINRLNLERAHSKGLKEYEKELRSAEMWRRDCPEKWKRHLR